MNKSILRNIIIALAISSMTIAGASPLFADTYTKLLIHSDTTNGSTTFVDSSASGHTITAYGNVDHSTAQSVFGQSSVCFDGNGDYLSAPDSSDWAFGTEDFTIDFWIYFNAIPATVQSLMGQYIDSTHRWDIAMRGDSANNFMFYYRNGDIEKAVWGTAPELNTWYHMAFVMSGQSAKVYKNGVGGGAADFSAATWPDWASTLNIGTNGSWASPNAYIDEIRTSKGIARWTENFTPHSSPQLFDDLSAGITSLTLGYDNAQKDQLYDLYCEGKFDTGPETPVTTSDDITWSYLDGDLPGDTGYNIGDSWELDGKYYVKLGSGLEGVLPLGGVPELPAGAMPFIGLVLSFGLSRLKRSHK